MLMTGRQEIRLSSLCPPFSHYTDAVWCNGILFVSGIVACDQEGKCVGKGDVVAQTEWIFNALNRILLAADLTSGDVAKITVYVTDIDHRAAINPVRQQFFGQIRPASTLVQVSALVQPDLLIEVDAIAVVPTTTRERLVSAYK